MGLMYLLLGFSSLSNIMKNLKMIKQFQMRSGDDNDVTNASLVLKAKMIK